MCRLSVVIVYQNRGNQWCWKLLYPATQHHNIGHLVDFQECVENSNSVYYQITHQSSVRCALMRCVVSTKFGMLRYALSKEEFLSRIHRSKELGYPIR